jgi:hypothetical protein
MKTAKKGNSPQEERRETAGIHYSVKCPKCSAHAIGHMRPAGIKGTYREAFIKLGIARLTCAACAWSEDVPPERADAYELWFATEFKGNRLWAVNRQHLEFLIDWLSGERPRVAKRWSNHTDVETLPKWMILAKNRPGVLKALSKLRDK